MFPVIFLNKFVFEINVGGTGEIQNGMLFFCIQLPNTIGAIFICITLKSLMSA